MPGFREASNGYHGNSVGTQARRGGRHYEHFLLTVSTKGGLVIMFQESESRRRCR